MKLAKNGLPNAELMTRLFAGKSAHGVGGCFSPAMGIQQSYLSKYTGKLPMDITEEVSSDSEQESDDVDENKSLPEFVVPKENFSKSIKRKKIEDTKLMENKRRQTSFDNVVELLSKTSVAPSRSKTKEVKEALLALGVHEKGGDEYFTEAMSCLEIDNRGDTFLELLNDNQKWMYLSKFIGCPPSY